MIYNKLYMDRVYKEKYSVKHARRLKSKTGTNIVRDVIAICLSPSCIYVGGGGGTNGFEPPPPPPPPTHTHTFGQTNCSNFAIFSYFVVKKN